MELKLSAWRKIRDMTQDEFAKAVGVSRATIYGWEHGNGLKMSMKHYLIIREVLRLEEGDKILFCANDEEKV